MSFSEVLGLSHVVLWALPLLVSTGKERLMCLHTQELCRMMFLVNLTLIWEYKRQLRKCLQTGHGGTQLNSSTQELEASLIYSVSFGAARNT